MLQPPSVPSTMGTAVQWAVLITAVVGTVGLIVTLLRIGGSYVRGNTQVTEAVEHLTDAVKKIDGKVEGYIAGETTRDDEMQDWRREVTGKLAALEASVDSLKQAMAMVLGPSVRGRRGGPARSD